MHLFNVIYLKHGENISISIFYFMKFSSYILEERIEKGKIVLYAEFPHGAIPLSLLISTSIYENFHDVPSLISFFLINIEFLIYLRCYYKKCITCTWLETFIYMVWNI